MRYFYATLTTALAWCYVFEIADTAPYVAQFLTVILGSFIIGALVKAANDLKKEDN